MMAEAVVIERADWALLERTRPLGVTMVLALTPNARAMAQGGPWPLIDPMSRYTDYAEARTVAHVTRARRVMLAALGPLMPPEREALIDLFNRVAYGAWRLYLTLGRDGPWLVPADAGFASKTGRQDAFEALVRHFLEPKLRGEIRGSRLASPPLPPLYRALRHLALLHHPLSGARIAIGAAKAQFGLFEVFERERLNVRSVLVSPPVAGWREYLKLAREIMRNARPGGMVQVALTGMADEKAASLADRAIAAMQDPVIRPAFELYRDLLAYKFAWISALRADAARVVRQLKPHVFTAAEISGPSTWLLAEACGGAGVPRLVLSRNAHAPAEGALARDGSVGYFKSRYPDGLVDEPLFYSPSGAAAARAALPEKLKPAIRPILARPAVTSCTRVPSERVILLADTYAAWWFPHSYVFLTGDGFVAAARSLAQAVAGMPNTRLVIRAKRKLECDLEALRALVAPPANCDIKMRDVPFGEDLAQADLLISFHSTTIEEGLFARKPVLLWGGTARYSFLPARETRPESGDRAALYRVRDKAALPAMIDAILAAHIGNPLTDVEIAPYCWPVGTHRIDDLAREIVARAAGAVAPTAKEASLAPS